MPRTDVLDYYVSLRRGERTALLAALLAGPFATHTEALAHVEPAQRMASDVDPRAHWDAHGTCSLPRAPGNPVGKLNDQLGIVPRFPPCPIPATQLESTS